MNNNYERDKYCVHLIVYHLVWKPKRCKAVLVNKIAQDCKMLIEKKCQEKGLTSHELRKKYLVLNRLPSLWMRSYFASTAGNVSAEVIQEYIAAQKGL